MQILATYLLKINTDIVHNKSLFNQCHGCLIILDMISNTIIYVAEGYLLCGHYLPCSEVNGKNIYDFYSALIFWWDGVIAY